jgi:hypothetical protein
LHNEEGILARLANLSPEKRALLELRLRERYLRQSEAKIIPLRSRYDPIPLSFAQQRLWFQDQLQPGNSIYNMSTALRLVGRLDIPSLERSLNEILRRHEVLRTTFPTTDGQPLQVIAPDGSLTLTQVRMEGLPANVREQAALRLAAEEAQKPFDLAKGPVIRTTLIRLAEHEHILLLTIHHIAADGWSMGILVGELAAHYMAFSTNQPSPLTELPIQYADFAVWQRQMLQGDVRNSQISYWREQLRDTPVLELPTDRPRLPLYSYNGAAYSQVLSASLTQRLKELSRREGVTLFMTLLAAFKVLLSSYSSADDIIVGTPLASRNRVELEGLIGLFANILVLRTDLSGNPSFQELLARVREVSLGAYAHQDIPFSMLVEELRPERNLTHLPLFQVMFTLQNALAPAIDLPDLKLSVLEVDIDAPNCDLTLKVTEMGDELKAVLQYNTDLFDAETMVHMLQRFEVLLEGVVADADRPVAELPLSREQLSEDEFEYVTDSFSTNNSSANQPEDTSKLVFIGPAELTPRYLETHINPYLNAINDLQHIIDEIKGRRPTTIRIKSVSQASPISVNLNGAQEAIQLIKDTIVPWRRKHVEKMARLLEKEKQAEIGNIKADILEKRARAARDDAESEKITAEAAKQREETERMKLENEKLRLELHRAKLQLTLDILAQISSNLSETEKIDFVVKLLPSLDVLAFSELEMK